MENSKQLTSSDRIAIIGSVIRYSIFVHSEYPTCSRKFINYTIGSLDELNALPDEELNKVYSDLASVVNHHLMPWDVDSTGFFIVDPSEAVAHLLQLERDAIRIFTQEWLTFGYDFSYRIHGDDE